MSLVWYGEETVEETGSFAAKAKGDPAVALAGLWNIHCIFRQTELLDS